MNSIALITGGFDPLHSGHLALIKSAHEMSLLVCVGLNSDAWLYRKKGYVFMPFSERKEILESLKGIDKVFGFSDAVMILLVVPYKRLLGYILVQGQSFSVMVEIEQKTIFLR